VIIVAIIDHSKYILYLLLLR